MYTYQDVYLSVTYQKKNIETQHLKKNYIEMISLSDLIENHWIKFFTHSRLINSISHLLVTDKIQNYIYTYKQILTSYQVKGNLQLTGTKK